MCTIIEALLLLPPQDSLSMVMLVHLADAVRWVLTNYPELPLLLIGSHGIGDFDPAAVRDRLINSSPNVCANPVRLRVICVRMKNQSKVHPDIFVRKFEISE